MAAVGDASLQGGTANLLETLDQIIAAEDTETAAFQQQQEQREQLRRTRPRARPRAEWL